MEDLPEITGTPRIPLDIEVRDYLRDHEFRGQAVFPAVEAMRVLADSARSCRSGLDPLCITAADFARFLPVETGAAVIDAFSDIEPAAEGMRAKLVSVRKSGKTSIMRSVEHVSLTFPGRCDTPAALPLDHILGLEGPCVRVDRESLYRELVPFKRAYQNVQDLFVSRAGALALVSGGSADAPWETLGSPFPLDASFHTACVWGQRFAGIVGFPVHIDSRIIMNKTRPGETYLCRVIPVETKDESLVFDIWLYDRQGGLCEAVRGLRMKDVSGKTLVPPEWIRCDGGDPLAAIRERCRGLCIIEIGSIFEPGALILSEAERTRFSAMREKRAKSFLAARMALKTLSRRISGNDMVTPPENILTIKQDGRPLCPLTTGEETMRCTASHDSRFAVAAVSDRPIGIDVEEISDRVMKGRHLYMKEEELALVKNHPLGEMEASTRVWSIKEAVAKASGMNLGEAWNKSTVREIGVEKSALRVADTNYEAAHTSVDDHLFTLVILD